MSQESNQKSKGFWGNTFSKLKSALSKTKEAVVDSVLPETEREPATQLAATVGEVQEKQDSEDKQRFSVSSSSTASVSTNFLDRPITVDADYLDDLEDKLIKADLGLSTVDSLMDHLRQSSKLQEWTGHSVQSFLKNEFSKILAAAPNHKLNIIDNVLNIILVVGVNGTGKTTSIGKLCRRLQSMDKKVLIAAGDTFRAAAESQLEIWAQRSNCDLLRLPSGSDPVL
jgi:fused signal recognition particle receptor